MRAAFFSHGRFEIREVPQPAMEAGDVLIAVHACGICGSDVHFYGGGVRAPSVCPGHEIAGRVARSSSASGLPVGAPVVVEPLRSCGTCPRCVAGEPNLCRRMQILGSSLPGGFAEAVVAPASSVHPIPNDLDLDIAVLAEPLAVAVHGVGLADLERGRNVLVLGGGTIGLLTAFVAVRAGCAVTIAVRHDHQRAAATRLGAARVVDADRTSVLAERDGGLPDVVFEAVGGRSDTIDLALSAVRAGGAIVTLGVFTAPIALHPLKFLAKEVRIVASMMYSRKAPVADFAAAIGLLDAHRVALATLITDRVPLDAIDRGFAAASDKRSGAIKVRVDVAQGSLSR